jgi:hypothetical protein
LNKNRDKLFFFFSNETLRGDAPLQLIQVTMPTALERAGDFSQSLDTNGRLVTLRDPLSGGTFLDNVIPTSRINANGQKMLQLFPLPNQLVARRREFVSMGGFSFERRSISI